MKRSIFKFYFRARRLNDAMDKLILRAACRSADGTLSGGAYAERIASLVEAKSELAALWSYLDGVMQGFCLEDRRVLFRYAFFCGRINGLPPQEYNRMRRVAVRFCRRARMPDRFARAVRIAAEYDALLGR